MDTGVVLSILLGVALMIAPFAYFIVSAVKMRKRMNDPNSYIMEPKEILEEEARVIDKIYGVEQTGSSKRPSHRIAYIVTFLLNDGIEKRMYVDKEEYQQIIIDVHGILITQNDNFLGFEIN